MKTTLALLCGGISAEDYLSRRSCELLLSELSQDKYNIFVLDWQKDGSVTQSEINNSDFIQTTHKSIAHCFIDFQGDVVLNLTHGELENSGQLQGLLELAKIPYTGNGLTASVIGMNKLLTKRYFRSLDIPTPRDFFFQPSGKDEYPEVLTRLKGSGLKYPLILKPLKGGSSEGIHLVLDQEELNHFIDTFYTGTPYVFEEYMPGEDYCVGVFSTLCTSTPIILPLAQITYSGEFFDAAIKHEGTYSVEFPDYLDPKTAKKMVEAALQMHRFIGCNGFSRTDFIVKDNEILALEINTHPGMSKHSIIPNMVKQSRLSLGSLFEQMIEDTLEKE